MKKILIPVDESESAKNAVRHVVSEFMHGSPMEIHVLNVQPPLVIYGEYPINYVLEFESSQLKHGELILESSLGILKEAEIPYVPHIVIGPIALTIIEKVKELHCNQIVMGTRGTGLIGHLILGSTAFKVVHYAQVPVTLIK